MIRTEMTGGGFVRRTFVKGDVRMHPGAILTAAQLASIPKNNRKALIEQGYIETWPEIPGSATRIPIDGAKRHVVLRGNKFDVIEGVKLNDRPLTREEANALALNAAGREEA